MIYPMAAVEARAVAPGIPSLEDQEKRDRVLLARTERWLIEVFWFKRRGFASPRQVCWSSRSRGPGADLRASSVIGSGWTICVTHAFLAVWSRGSPAGVRPVYDIRALRKASQDGPFTVAPDSALVGREPICCDRQERRSGQRPFGQKNIEQRVAR